MQSASICSPGRRCSCCKRPGRSRRSIPIFIGEAEAVAIECAVRGVPATEAAHPRPVEDVITELGATVARVVITELRDATYYAEVHLDVARATSIVSARPSDAVALALRTESPLFVDDQLMDEEGRMIELADEDEETRARLDGDVDELAEQFRDFLDTVHPEDFQP